MKYKNKSFYCSQLNRKLKKKVVESMVLQLFAIKIPFLYNKISQSMKLSILC